MLGKKIQEIETLKPAANQLIASLTDAFKTKKLQAGQFSLQTVKGNKVFKYTIAPEIYNHTITSAVSIMSDITEIKAMERKLLQHSEHLEELVKEKTEELKKAERMAGIGETAGMIGHDIRNPLQTITGSVYLAKEEIQNMPESDGKKVCRKA